MLRKFELAVTIFAIHIFPLNRAFFAMIVRHHYIRCETVKFGGERNFLIAVFGLVRFPSFIYILCVRRI